VDRHCSTLLLRSHVSDRLSCPLLISWWHNKTIFLSTQVELITQVCDSTTHLNSVSMMQLFWWQGLPCTLGTPSHPTPNPSSHMACVTLLIFQRYICISFSHSHNQRQTQQMTGWSVVLCALQVLETPHDLQVFSVMMHTHLAGRKVRVGHFRYTFLNNDWLKVHLKVMCAFLSSAVHNLKLL